MLCYLALPRRVWHTDFFFPVSRSRYCQEEHGREISDFCHKGTQDIHRQSKPASVSWGEHAQTSHATQMKAATSINSKRQLPVSALSTTAAILECFQTVLLLITQRNKQTTNNQPTTKKNPAILWSPTTHKRLWEISFKADMNTACFLFLREN